MNSSDFLRVDGKSMKKTFHPSSIQSTALLNHEDSLHQTLSDLEKTEIREYPTPLYFGQNCSAKKQLVEEYDDSRGDYNMLKGDQIAFRYEILEILGKGSFGQVVCCVDHATGRKVALKILEKLKQADYADSHAIVKIESSFYFRNHLCIVFPLLSINLYEFIKQNNFSGFSLSLIRRITSQVVDSLYLLQRLNIIHCDLKPENILLVSPNKSSIRVIDFGSSCFIDERIYTYIQSRFYRCPEIVLGLEYGPAIDMWSLGCIMAELYTGYPIFPAQDEQELMGCFMELLGEPPAELLDRASRRKVFFHSNGAPRIVPNSKGKIRGIATKTFSDILKQNTNGDSGYNAFVDFVRRCLHWDPQTRMTAFEAKQHPFLAVEASLAKMTLNSPKKAVLPPISSTASTTSAETYRTLHPQSQSNNSTNRKSHHNYNPPSSSSTGGLAGSYHGSSSQKYRSHRYSSETSSGKSPMKRDLNNGWGNILNDGFTKIMNGFKSFSSSRENLMEGRNGSAELSSVTVDESSKRSDPHPNKSRARYNH